MAVIYKRKISSRKKVSKVCTYAYHAWCTDLRHVILTQGEKWRKWFKKNSWDEWKVHPTLAFDQRGSLMPNSGLNFAIFWRKKLRVSKLLAAVEKLSPKKWWKSAEFSARAAVWRLSFVRSFSRGCGCRHNARLPKCLSKETASGNSLEILSEWVCLPPLGGWLFLLCKCQMPPDPFCS